MNVAECYRVLELESGAPFDAVKASYRRLARQYHPDVNPGNQWAKDRFIEITAAYKFLLSKLVVSGIREQATSPKTVFWRQADKPKPAQDEPSPKSRPKAAKIQFNPTLTPIEQELKLHSYNQLQQLLKTQRFPRAIALVEGLAQRLPQDPEVTQWQAIAYQRWGRRLIQEKQLDKARIYLKKALRTDPHNRSLWAEVEKDFRYMEQMI